MKRFSVIRDDTKLETPVNAADSFEAAAAVFGSDVEIRPEGFVFGIYDPTATRTRLGVLIAY